jgi:hypothetical protein
VDLRILLEALLDADTSAAAISVTARSASITDDADAEGTDDAAKTGDRNCCNLAPEHLPAFP